jgi:putative transposase
MSHPLNEEGNYVPYWQLFYHLVWSTKNRQPFLTPSVEPIIFGFLRSKAIALGGVVLAINGMFDHVHMIVSIPPRIAVAEFVGQVKGVASARFNKGGFAEERFEWQADYRAFSFDGKRLPYLIAYVEKQKEHHAQGSTIAVLERTIDGSVRQTRESIPTYITDYQLWLEDMRSQ